MVLIKIKNAKMSKKTKIILVIILLSTVVLVTLIFIPRWEKAKQLALLEENFQRCQNLEDLAGNIDINWVLGEKSSFHCIGIHDIYFCNLALNQEEKEQCENLFYSFQALKENNIDYCQKAREKEFFCQAVLKRDEALCEKGTLPQGEKILCTALIREDEEECRNLPETEIQKCKDNFYNLLAILKKDIALCDRISYKRGAQILCRGVIDINECLKYRSEVECPEIYLPRIAEFAKEPYLCEKILYKNEEGRGELLYQSCLERAE